MRSHRFLAVFVAACGLAAQAPPVAVEKRGAVPLLRPYEGPRVSAARLTNSDRFRDLIRAGRLYLSVQDAIALAIENNLDLEVDRYGPLGADWQLERMRGGGPLRGVTSGSSLVNQVTSGQGVLGSYASAGLGGGGGGGGGGGAGGAVVSQIGPIAPNFDPVLQNATAFSHTTHPQANATVSQIGALVNTRHIYNTLLQQGLLTGGYVQITANESYLKENAPTDILNPSVAPVAQVYLRQNFLQGFGTRLNSRYIRIAEKNIGLAHETFRSQLLNVVARVLNLYWDLVSSNDQVKVRQHTLDIVQKFYEDTRHEVELGEVARFELGRTEAEVQMRRNELAIAQAAVHQQENLLKDALSRNGLGDPLIDSVEVVPLDRIQVPERDELPPLRQLVAIALAKRPDVAIGDISQETARISSLGTANSLLPTLQGLAALSASGLAGTAVPQPGGFTADPYYVGGLSDALAQIFRHNFANYRTAVQFQGRLGNRQSQSDYGIEQLQLRQNELIRRRALNQLVVDISNQVVALRQARARYSTAVNTSALEAQLLEKEQQKFALGGSRISDVLAAQRSLAAAQQVEIAAQVIYAHARVSLDQVLGETLERNNVSVEEGLSGRVRRQSALAEPLNAPPKP